MDWDGNAKQQARDERFVAKAHTFSWFVFWGWGNKLASSQAYPRPLSCPSRPAAVGSPHLSSTSPVFGPSCMRQKLVPRTVRRPSPTPAIMVQLRSTNTNKIQFTQRLSLGPELHMGKERCCLRDLDHLHGPTSHSICGNFMIYKPSPTSENQPCVHNCLAEREKAYSVCCLGLPRSTCVKWVAYSSSTTSARRDSYRFQTLGKINIATCHHVHAITLAVLTGRTCYLCRPYVFLRSSSVGVSLSEFSDWFHRYFLIGSIESETRTVRGAKFNQTTHPFPGSCHVPVASRFLTKLPAPSVKQI